MTRTITWKNLEFHAQADGLTIVRVISVAQNEIIATLPWGVVLRLATLGKMVGRITPPEGGEK